MCLIFKGQIQKSVAQHSSFKGDSASGLVNVIITATLQLYDEILHPLLMSIQMRHD